MFALALMASGAHPAIAADETLELAVWINGASINQIGEFVLRDAKLLAKPKELQSLGLKVPAEAPSVSGGLVALASLRGLQWRLDQSSQTLYFTARDEQLVPRRLEVEGAQDRAGGLQSGLGATLDYDFTENHAAGHTETSGSYDVRLFSPWGVVTSNFLAFSDGGPANTHGPSTIRLDTSYVYADPDSLRQYTAGDFISGGLSSSRPVRLGGLQISSNFGLQPGLITFPLPTLGGSAAVPSTIDVLVNGNQVFSHSVDPGPFEIPQLPLVTGAGTLQMTVTNALGKQVVVNTPFYAGRELLATGLQAYSLQVGALRRNWGSASFDYDRPAAVATYRRGVFTWLTPEVSLEATDHLVMASAGLSANLASLALVSAAIGASNAAPSAEGQRQRRRIGARPSLSIQRIGRTLSFSAAITTVTGGFQDIAAATGDPSPSLQISSSLGLSLGRFGTAGLSYAEIEHETPEAATRSYVWPGGSYNHVTYPNGSVVTVQPAQRARMVSASYSIQIHGVSLFATALRDFAKSGSEAALLGLSLSFGPRGSISASGGLDAGGRYGQLEAQKSPIAPGDFGYTLADSVAQTDHAFAQGEYKSPWGLLTAGVDREDHSLSFRAEAEGAVSVLNGGVFPSNTVHDSFAVVDTDGLPNVQVTQENRDAGRTNGAGLLLVPELRSFDTNHIAINPNDVPQDASLATSSQIVRPQYHAGMVVHFRIKASRGALLRLADAAGKPLPLGSVATLAANGVAVPVGFDGEAYVEDLAAHNELRVEQPDGKRCTVRFPYRAVSGEIPRIGPIACQP